MIALRILLAAAALLVAVESARAQAEAPTRPFVRARLDPAGPVVVGQRVELSIDVFVPTWFTSPPVLPPVDLDGALATPLPTTTHQSESVGDATWSGVRYYYAVTSQTAGTIHIPSIALTFQYAIEARPSPPVTVRTGALAFNATLPPGAESLDYFFAAADMHLTESYDPRPSPHLSVGDAFSRRIVLSAPDVNALTLPPLLEPEVSGLEVTADAPEISSTVDRSATTVTRSTRLTYVAKEPGTYTLPSIEVSYWSTSANAIRKRTLPAVHFDVAAAPAVAEEIALPPDTDAVATPPPSRWASIRRAVRQWWPVVVGAVALTWLGWRLLAWLGPIVKRRRAEARQRRLESEDHYFDEVRRAAHSGDLRATHAAALAWLTRFAPLGGPASLTALAERVGDVGMRGRMDAVNSSLFGRQATGDSSRALASQLERDLDDARQRLLSDDRSRPGVRHLGPLNPI